MLGLRGLMLGLRGLMLDSETSCLASGLKLGLRGLKPGLKPGHRPQAMPERFQAQAQPQGPPTRPQGFQARLSSQASEASGIALIRFLGSAERVISPLVPSGAAALLT